MGACPVVAHWPSARVLDYGTGFRSDQKAAVVAREATLRSGSGKNAAGIRGSASGCKLNESQRLEAFHSITAVDALPVIGVTVKFDGYSLSHHVPQAG